MKDLLISTINNFADNGIVFSNEQDFQFQLALALKGQKYNENGTEVTIKDVFLEVASFDHEISETIERLRKKQKKGDNEKESKTKEYTDLILELDDGKNITHVAIELKYKTPYSPYIYETSKGKTLLMGQGAYDIGAYLFLKDIARLENIKKRYFVKEMNITKCYAIMLTNENHYRNGFDSKIWKSCNINEKANLQRTIALDLSSIGEDDEKKKKYQSYKSISLNGYYELKNMWHDYHLLNKNGDAPDFSFLIVEIQPK